MPTFDLVIRGGTLVDGTGAPGRPADVGIREGRIAAVGELAAVDPGTVPVVLDARRRVVCPGFIDPHGHSDASVLVDGALISHLRQGFTTQLSGNCGDSLAPVTALGRSTVELSLRSAGLEPSWTTMADYLAAVERQPLGPNVAFLVGHGTLRAAVLGASDAAARPEELAAMGDWLEEALDAGVLGLSSGLIYAPGLHAGPEELAHLARIVAAHGALYATHMRNEERELFEAIDEALATARAGGSGLRLQVSHLKAGARPVWGRAAEAVGRLEEARAEDLDVAADQYPYTAAATTLATLLPPDIVALDVDGAVEALEDPTARARITARIEAGDSGWRELASDPGWDDIVVAEARAHPDWAGRSFGELASEAGRPPLELALEALAADRLDVSIVVHCMTESDVEAILAVPWIAVCTDAEGRRPGHPILDVGRPHPRTYGSTARVLGRYVRERGVLSLETAIAKLTAVPAARLGLGDRGIVREGMAADLVVLDPETVADLATYADPSRHPAGIEHVVVNGVVAIRDGAETGARPGRLLRRA